MSLVGSVINEIRDDSNWFIWIVFGVLSLIVTIISISLSVRRWHDLNKSGWWVLVNLIPVVGWIYTLVMLGFVPGDQGSNRYGPPPLEGAIL